MGATCVSCSVGSVFVVSVAVSVVSFRCMTRLVETCTGNCYLNVLMPMMISST